MESILKKQLEDLANEWCDELNEIKIELEQKGGEAHTQEYGLLATKALVLSECVRDIHYNLRMYVEKTATK